MHGSTGICHFNHDFYLFDEKRTDGWCWESGGITVQPMFHVFFSIEHWPWGDSRYFVIVVNNGGPGRSQDLPQVKSTLQLGELAVKYEVYREVLSLRSYLDYDEAWSLKLGWIAVTVLHKHKFMISTEQLFTWSFSFSLSKIFPFPVHSGYSEGLELETIN
jgi:hypothetical protein